MAVEAAAYGSQFLALYLGLMDWTNDSIKCSLHLVGYVPNKDTNTDFEDTSNEAPATGNYTAGGVALGTKTSTYSSSVHTLDAANMTIGSSTIANVRRAVVYNDTPSVGSKTLIAYQTSDTDISTTGGAFTVAWAGAGIVTLTVAAQSA